jgi:UDP-GlcNAc:undecaprenyl-phosphate/decaprenyl-phosphate GlcNAc-1-phosphate transferase
MTVAITLAAGALLALVISSAITPAVIYTSHKRQWYDIPNERKIHTNPIPRLGGIAIFAGLIVSAVAVPLLLPVLFHGDWPVSYAPRYLALFLAFAMIHVMGLVDDFHNLEALLKLCLQVLAAIVVCAGGFTISHIEIPWSPIPMQISLGIFSYPLTVFWIVAISNAVNLVDGVDGMAGGIAAFSALSMALMCILAGEIAPALIAFCLLGAVLGFLTFNFPPARIFMVDSGSLLLGFVLAVIPLVGTPGATTVGEMFPAATILLIPIMDTATAIMRRVREKRAIHSADKEHIHHKLLALGIKETSLLSIIYSSCIVFGAAAVGSLYLPPATGGVLLGITWLMGVLGYGVLRTFRYRQKALLAHLEGGTPP